MLKKAWWVVFAIGVSFPLLVAQAGKIVGTSNNPYILTTAQQMFLVCAVAVILGYIALEYDPYFENFFLLIGILSIPVLGILYGWSILYLGQVMKELFPEHSVLLTVAQFALVFLFIADAAWSNPHSGVESNSRRPQNQNYSKTVAWYVYYK